MATQPVAPATLNITGDTSLTTQEATTITPANTQWTPDFAKKIALADFNKAATFRNQNHDRRFRESNRLLTGWTEKKVWEGTRIPRSALPVYIALQEIQVLLPRVLSVIFDDPTPFEAYPEPGSTLQQAYAIKTLIGSQIRDIGKPGQNLTIRELCRRSYESALTYGAGPIEFGWWQQSIDRPVYDRVAVADTVTVPHPITAEPIQVPNGQLRFQVVNRQEKYQISRPYAQPVQIEDFYIDPNCTSPNPQDALYTATRHLIPIREIKTYANLPGFKIPSDKDLVELAHMKVGTIGDTTKQMQESYRGNMYSPIQDQSADPELLRIEMIRYWRKDRYVWLLGREHPMCNEPNPYGIVPHINSFYTNYLGRFYGFSICDLVEGDHKLAQNIINNRVDELNLILHAPIIRKRGAFVGASGQRFHPGVKWEVLNDVETDVKRMDMGVINPTAFAEVQALEQRVQKLTGNTDAAAYGVASSGGDSSARTAHGIAAKQSAANSRVEYQVENFEDQFLEPLLYIFLSLDKKYLNPQQVIQIMGPDSQLIELDPLTVLNASVRFEVRASAKMKMRNSMQAGGFQQLAQTYLNPGYIQAMHQIGQTLDIANLDRIACDTFNIPQSTLMRPMTPQEQQSLQQQQMAELMSKMQLQDARLQSNEQNQDASDETALIKEMFKLIMTPEVAHAMLVKRFGMEHPAQTAAKFAPKQIPAKGKN
jgi:hypothetical protein